MKSSNTDPVSPLDYCKMGWPIIPVRRNKRPFLLDWPNRGSTDQHEISSWEKTFRGCNLGVLPGKCGLAIVDVDPRNSGDASWSDLLSTPGAVPIATARVETGGGGYHLYFSSGENKLPSTKLASGVDLIASTGYAVVPPSIHASGKPYEWVISPFDNELQPFPQFLLNALNQQKKGDGGLLDQIFKGARNSTLFRYAMRLLNQGFDDSDILATLIHANESRCNPPLPERDIHIIAKSVSRYRSDVSLLWTFENTDLGNARRLTHSHGEILRYWFNRRKWLIWDGLRWKGDDTQDVYRKIEDMIRTMHLEVGFLDDPERRIQNSKWAVASESRYKISAMEALARSQIPVESANLDANPMLLNVANGTIDLRSGDLRDHVRSDLITKVLDVEYLPDANCPSWLRFIQDVSGGDVALQNYIQRAVGYTLSGKTDEHCLFFLYGLGANGKTTFIEAIKRLLSDYALKVNTGALLDPNRSGDRPNPAIASLAGARLAIGSEIPQDRILNEALIKDITGGDTITARFLHCNPFSFQPTHKIWLYGNHMPRIRGESVGIWRRIRVIPFQVAIPEDKRRPMSEILEEYRGEAAGILAWAVEGCLKWQSDGLGSSVAVLDATQAYRTEEDRLQQFLNDCCVRDPSRSGKKRSIFQRFQEWAKSNNELDLLQWTKKKFSRRLSAKGIKSGGHANLEYIGVGIKPGAIS